MNTQKVITNLRMDKNEWLQTKVIAAELGLSVNEYINQVIREQTVKKSFPASNKNSSSSMSAKKYSIWRMWEISEGVKPEPMDISEEDKIIYGI